MNAYNWPMRFAMDGQSTITNPDKDRSLRGKKRRRAVRKARRTERNLYARGASGMPSDCSPAPTATHHLEDLYNWTLSELREKASKWSIPGRSKMNKADLVEALYRSEANQR